MANDKNKKKIITTKKKLDDSIEIEVNKSPAKTTLGKVIIALIIIGTVLVPVAIAIASIIQAM